MSISIRHAAAILALGFLAFHLPSLPSSLEDVDSINFALGIRDFDVAQHQPHPPGYPLFILAAAGVNALVSSEAHALALIGIVAGALSAFSLTALFGALDGHRRPGGAATAATWLAVTAPLFWITAARPLSDVAGLASALVVQALILRARTPRHLVVAAACAGFAVGVRSQVAWLTLPLLLFAILRPPLRGWRSALGVALAYPAAALLWGVPLLMLSGGPAAYWQALSNQGAEDLSGVVMLWTTPTARQLASALYQSFVAPWALWQLAAVMVAFAIVGLARLASEARPVLTALVVAYGPYFAFNLLFQETATTRYALPLVVPLAYLTARG